MLSGPLFGDSKQTQNAILNVLTSPPDVADEAGIPGNLHDEKDTTNVEKLSTYHRNTIIRSDGKYSVQLPLGCVSLASPGVSRL